MNELKQTGWILIILGIFLPIYSAATTAIDALVRGYDVGKAETERYKVEQPLLWDAYLGTFIIGIIFAVFGIVVVLVVRYRASKNE